MWDRPPSELPESLFGGGEGGLSSPGGGHGLSRALHGGHSAGGLRARPGRPLPARVRDPDPHPGPRPRPGPGRPRRAPRARAGERAPLTRWSRSAPPRSGRAGAESSSRPARGLPEVRGAAGQSEATRGRGPGSPPRPARRRRCHPGLATPTLLTIAELEVSGLRGRWAGFQQRRLSLATKRQSGPGEGSKERTRRGQGRPLRPPGNLQSRSEALGLAFLRGKYLPLLGTTCSQCRVAPLTLQRTSLGYNPRRSCWQYWGAGGIERWAPGAP